MIFKIKTLKILINLNMPYCGTNCLIFSRCYGAPAGAAEIIQNIQNEYTTQTCQNCPNQFTHERNLLCDLCNDCALPGSVAYSYHHRHCCMVSPIQA